jgi:hypothetical protein
MMVARMKGIKNQKGQALIELIIFLPLMFMFYAMISGFANSINASINQQKITRAYFYYRVQNNSTMPKPNPTGSGYSHQSWGTFGIFFIGWKDYFVNSKPIAPCYKISVPLQASGTDKCEETYTQPTTQFIRVQTVYGICGATYQNTGQFVLPVPDYPGGDFSTLTNAGGCLITGP